MSEPVDLALGTRLAIIRHGEAHCNVESFIGGHLGCKGLTARGVHQVEVLADRLRRTQELAGCAALYTSVLARAVESTEILADVLGVENFERRCDLCERHPGVADGLSWEEFEARYQRTSLPGDDPDTALSEGGETWVEFVDRVGTALVTIAGQHPGELIVVVAHGGVIDSSMINFLGIPSYGAGVRLHPEHTSITEWEYVGSRWRLARYSDAGHLIDSPESDLYAPAPDWVHIDRANTA